MRKRLMGSSLAIPRIWQRARKIHAQSLWRIRRLVTTRARSRCWGSIWIHRWSSKKRKASDIALGSTKIKWDCLPLMISLTMTMAPTRWTNYSGLWNRQWEKKKTCPDNKILQSSVIKCHHRLQMIREYRMTCSLRFRAACTRTTWPRVKKLTGCRQRRGLSWRASPSLPSPR